MAQENLYSLLSEDRIRKTIESFKPTTIEDAGLRPAGVLVPLFSTGEDIGVVLTVRTHRVEHHKGEISFPGGGRDPEDATLLETALREAHEEVGLRPEDVAVLGQLDDTQTRSGFLVRPSVGLIPAAYPFRLRPWEVEEVLTIPLSHLLNPAQSTLEWRAYRGQWQQTPVYHYSVHEVWGATARILEQLLSLITQGA